MTHLLNNTTTISLVNFQFCMDQTPTLELES